MAIRSAADHFVLKSPRTQTPRYSASSQLQFKSTGCTDAGSWLLSVAVSCGRKRSCCAGGYLFLRPSPNRPYLRTKDLLLTSQTTNKLPPAHLPSLFGASRLGILRNWTPTAFGLDQLSGGTDGRNGQKSCIARIRGRLLGSDPELNRAEVQSEHHISTTALSGGLPRLASALYHQSTRNIFAVLFLLLPKMALFVFIFLLFRRPSSASWQAKMQWKSYTSRNAFSIAVSGRLAMAPAVGVFEQASISNQPANNLLHGPLYVEIMPMVDYPTRGNHRRQHWFMYLSKVLS